MSGHEELIELMHGVQATVDRVEAKVTIQNGRVRKLETAMAVLRWIVMSGGAGVVGALTWLVVKHMAV
jgi:hypothetical protein